jgi:tRNA (guanine37-N1)-methyltransferase
MKFSVITIFPELITGYTDESILGQAQENNLISVAVYNPRDFTQDSHNSIDAPPYGGGPGMVMQAKPLLRAVKKAQDDSKKKREESEVFIMSAGGDQFDSEAAENIEADVDHAIIICGRYEGVDQRVIEALDPTPVSVGPYILTGGELPALTIIDTISRFVPGVLGDEDSLEQNRETAGAPTYTRPKSIVWGGQEYTVPDILLSGHHQKIREWRIINADTENQKSSKQQDKSENQ